MSITIVHPFVSKEYIIIFDIIGELTAPIDKESDLKQILFISSIDSSKSRLRVSKISLLSLNIPSR